MPLPVPGLQDAFQEDIEPLAREAYDELPEEVRSLCGDVVIRVTDFATEEVLQDMRIDSPYDLLGLFQGIGKIQTRIIRKEVSADAHRELVAESLAEMKSTGEAKLN